MRVSEDVRDDLRRLALAMAKDAIEKVVELRDNGYEFRQRTSYPKFNEEGPQTYRTATWSSSTGSPTRYSAVFGKSRAWDTEIAYGELDGFEELLSLVRRSPALLQYLAPDRLSEDQREHILHFHVADLPIEMAERHIHTVGWELEESKLLDFYLELEHWWLSETLVADLLVPIVGISFAEDAIELGDGCSVTSLSEKENLARWPGQTGHDLESVLGMTTHALVVPSFTFANESALAWLRKPDPPKTVPQVDRFFEALAITTEAPSGYAHVVYRPVGWSLGYTADLPVFIGTPVFDRVSLRLDRQLREPGDQLDAGSVAQLVGAYDVLRSSSGSVPLAAHRLISADFRQSDADRIVDLCTGIEALAGGATPGETTYKISIRTAAVLAHRGSEFASEFVAAMKRVYGHRSAVVHGRSGSSPPKPVSIGGRTHTPDSVARFVLRQLLLDRLDSPSEPAEAIDERVIGPALDAWSAQRRLALRKEVGE